MQSSAKIALQAATGVLVGAMLLFYFSALGAQALVSADQSVFGPHRWWNSEVPAHIASTRAAYRDFGAQGLFAGAAWTVGGSGYLADSKHPLFAEPIDANHFAVGQLRFVEGQAYVSFPPGVFLLNVLLPDVAKCSIFSCMLHVLPIALGLGLFIAGLFVFLQAHSPERQLNGSGGRTFFVGFCLGVTPIVGVGVISTYWGYSGMVFALGSAAYFAAKKRVVFAIACLGLGVWFSFSMLLPLILFAACALLMKESPRRHVISSALAAVLAVPLWFLVTFAEPAMAAQSLLGRVESRSLRAVSTGSVTLLEASWWSLGVSGAIALATLLAVLYGLVTQGPPRARIASLMRQPLTVLLFSTCVLLLVEQFLLKEHWIVYSFSHLLWLPLMSLPMAIWLWRAPSASMRAVEETLLPVALVVVLLSGSAVFGATYDPRFAYDANTDMSLQGLPVAHFQEELFVAFR